jgi:transketolase
LINNWKDITITVANGIRRRVLEHTLKHDGGYMSQACSSAEILAALFVKIMNLPAITQPQNPLPFSGVPSNQNPNAFTGARFNGERHPDYDRFFLSPAHYALCLYALLIETGRMAEEALIDYNKDGSSVEMIGAEHSPGMEITTGSLGQCLSQAAGIAWARRRKGESGRTWVFMSDGEFQIGQTWEALQCLSHFHLDTVGIIIDANGQQCDGTVESVMNIEPLHDKLTAFGARVCVVDGHDIEGLSSSAKPLQDGRPLIVLAKTDPCRNLELLRKNYPRLHYLRFRNPEEKEPYLKFLRTLS